MMDEFSLTSQILKELGSYKMRELDSCGVHTRDLNFIKDLSYPHIVIHCEGESAAIY